MANLMLKICLAAGKFMVFIVIPAALILTIFTSPIRPHDATMAKCFLWPHPVPAKVSEGYSYGPICDRVTLNEFVALPGAEEVEYLDFRFTGEVPTTDLSSLASLRSLTVTGPARGIEQSAYTVPNLSIIGAPLEVARGIDFTKMPQSFRVLALEADSENVDLSWIKPVNNMAILVRNKTKSATYSSTADGKTTTFRVKNSRMSQRDFPTNTGNKVTISIEELDDEPDVYDVLDMSRETVWSNPLRLFLRWGPPEQVSPKLFRCSCTKLEGPLPATLGRGPSSCPVTPVACSPR